MARKSAFDRLTTLAGKIDALNKKADTLASRLLRTTNPRKVAGIERSGASVEKQLRKLESRFRAQERTVLRPSRATGGKVSTREREAEERSILEELRVGQRFFVQATYRRKNHRLVVDVILTYVGLPIDPDSYSGEKRIRDAVLSLAAGKKPMGFDVERVSYDPKNGVTRRRNSELEKIKDALASNNTQWKVGEL